MQPNALLTAVGYNPHLHPLAEALVAHNPTPLRGHRSLQSRLKSEFFTADW